MQIINHSKLQKMIAGDEDLLADLAIMFVQNLPELESKIRFGIENNDPSAVESAAHQLKSRLSYFGATNLREQAGELELAARDGKSDCIAPLQTKLFSDLDQLIEELRILTNLSLETDED